MLYSYFIFSFLFFPAKSPSTEVEQIRQEQALINGKIHLVSTTKELTEFFPKPDSIVEYSPDCGGFFAYPDHQYYWGNTFFEAEKDSAVLVEMNVTSGKFWLQTSKGNLKKGTKLKDVEKMYPESVKESYNKMNPQLYDGHHVVRISTGEDWSVWVLFFDKKGRLIKIHYAISC